jgi:hypothetical protein
LSRDHCSSTKKGKEQQKQTEEFRQLNSIDYVSKIVSSFHVAFDWNVIGIGVDGVVGCVD